MTEDKLKKIESKYIESKYLEENEDIQKLVEEIIKLKKIYDTWSIEYHMLRVFKEYDRIIGNKNADIKNLQERVTELEICHTEDKGKINIELVYDKLHGTNGYVIVNSDSKRRNSIFDECGRKWYIPKLNDDSYIKIKFTGKNFDKKVKNGRDKFVIWGLSTSSSIIGTTIFGRGKYSDIENGYVLDKKQLDILLISPDVWFYVPFGTDDIEIVESSEDINASIRIVEKIEDIK